MAAINKSFVIKNGLEVNTNLIFADAPEGKVGIGTTNPEYLLHVKGGIGATDSFVSGISTTGVLHVGTAGTVITATAAGSVGLGTTNPQYKLHVIGGIGVTDSFVTGVSTVLTTLRVGTGGTVLTVLGVGNSIGIGTTSPAFLLDIRSPVSTGQTALYVQGDVRITGDLSVDDITFDDATLSNLTVTEALNVTSPGISTLGGYVDINSDVDISGTLNVVGLSTLSGYVDINNSVDISNNLNVTGIATIATVDINAGEIDVTRIGTGNLNVTGIGTIVNGTITNLTGTAGTITTFNSTNGTITNLTGTAGTITTLSSTNGTITNLTGTAATIGTVQIFSGIITATSGIVTYYGDGTYLTGTASSPNLQTVLNTGNTSSTGINITGVITATSFVGSGANLTGIANTANIVSTAITTGILNVGTGITANSSGINVTGVVTATSFVGNGSGLTGAGSTVADDTTTNQTFYPIFTQTTSGTITASKVSTTKLSFNPSNGILTVVDLNSTSDINLKENIKTVDNALETISSLRGVSFDWKENGRSSYGVIAQELEKVLPELVGDGETKSVNYNGIIGVLIEAIKELKKEVRELKSAK